MDTGIEPTSADFQREDFGSTSADLSIADAPGSETTKIEVKAPRLYMMDDSLNKHVDETIGYLTREPEKFEVVSIFHWVALGKTSVARKVYNHTSIKHEFPNRIWVDIGQRSNTKNYVLLSILRGLTHEDHYEKSCDELVRLVQEYLKVAKLFIVMDDVWTNEQWNGIMEILPKGDLMIKVLITTRHESVSNYATGDGKMIHMKFLNPNESWHMLQLEIFGRVGDCPKELKELGKDIVKRVQGIPFYILAVGALLLQKFSPPNLLQTEREWKKVFQLLESGPYYAVEHSFYYDALPYDLRICFLYLGIFPKDFEIPVWKLTQLWIEEGFIQKETGMSLDEIAKRNVMKLINRNLLFADKVSFTGEVKTCRINSIERDFINSNTLVKSLNLFHEVCFKPPSPVRQERFKPIPVTQYYRRLCIHNYVLDFLHERPKVKKAQSFLCFSREPIVMDSTDISNFTDDFGLVRVLEASTINFRTFPPKFTQLVLLRYLTLSGDEIVVLPGAISNLWNLQTLVVNTSSSTLEIGEIIWSMMKLKHLKTKASIILKEGMGEGGKQVQTLTKLSPNSFTPVVSNKIKNLKKLGFRGDLSCLSNLQNLDCLEKLTLKHDVYPNENSENPLRRLPPDFPPRIKILVLSGTYLQWKNISTLGEIGMLEVLELKDNAFVGNAWDANESGFTHLDALSIEHTNLKYWTASNNSFPELRHLELKCCKKLLDVPFELGKKLETLSMSNVTKFAVSCARKIEAHRANRGAFNLRIDT